MEWPNESLASICQATDQRDPRRDPTSEFLYVDIAGIDRIHKSIADYQRLLGIDAPSRGRKVIHEDDILVSTVRPNLNAVAMVPAHLDGQIASTGFCVLRPDRAVIEPRYLFYFSITPGFVAELMARVRGANYPAVSDSDVKEAEIPLPPLSEQRRIVEILDQADRLRRLRAKADAQADRILPALFIKMFGDPATNPMGWPVKRFDEICESRLGKMLDQKQQTGQHPRPYLRNANVYWDRLDLQEVLEMDFDGSDREEFRLNRGDILICEGGEVGRCVTWNDELPECYFQKALHRARPYPGTATPEFIVYLFFGLAQRGVLQDTVSRMTFSHLTGVKLKALRIPVPPFPLQEKFTMQVRAIKNVLRQTGLRRNRITSLFHGLLHRAFSSTLTASWREAHMDRAPAGNGTLIEGLDG